MPNPGESEQIYWHDTDVICSRVLCLNNREQMVATGKIRCLAKNRYSVSIWVFHGPIEWWCASIYIYVTIRLTNMIWRSVRGVRDGADKKNFLHKKGAIVGLVQTLESSVRCKTYLNALHENRGLYGFINVHKLCNITVCKLFIKDGNSYLISFIYSNY